MAHDQQKLNELLDKMQTLLQRQETFAREINNIKAQIDQLVVQQFDEVPTPAPIETPKTVVVQAPPPPPPPAPVKPSRTPMEMEKFIGENLINKIGIAITIIGVSIGAKYAIDHELISPLVRILLGCLVGVVLIGFGYHLKSNYRNFSAVLLGGGIAINYFMTYLGFDLYALMPREVAFGIMVLLTVYTVWEAVRYDEEVIALIGLVGAYAVPFLLSDGSDRVAVLYSYIFIINVGILWLSFRRLWIKVYVTAFGLTWLIFITWASYSFKPDEHLLLGMVFGALFYLTFYVTFLAYKWQHNEQFQQSDVFVILLNTFLFYITCYAFLNQHKTANDYLGLFTLCNAVLHTIVAALIQMRSSIDKQIVHLISGLALLFITLAVPVQFDGNWVTLLWAGQAALLFWIGRTQAASWYEKLAYPLMLLATLSLFQDWSAARIDTWDKEIPAIQPFASMGFFTSLAVMALFGFIYYIHQQSAERAAYKHLPDLNGLINIGLASVLILGLFNTFFQEIELYWNLRVHAIRHAVQDGGGDTYEQIHHLQLIKSCWLIGYAMVYAAGLSVVQLVGVKNAAFAKTTFVLNALALFFFLTAGLYALSELRDLYLHPSDGFAVSSPSLGYRYVMLAIGGFLLMLTWRIVQLECMRNSGFQRGFEFVLFTSVLWISSSELLHWMAMNDSQSAYKLALSILWGSYSLAVISIGIWKKKQHLRISAMVLFGATLLKLFLYDISHLNTLSKTIVFVTLGVLLLIISFLYNKYKHLIGE